METDNAEAKSQAFQSVTENCDITENEVPDSQDTYCEVMSPRALEINTQDNSTKEFSNQSLFSQETQLISLPSDGGDNNMNSEENQGTSSNEVILIPEAVPLIVLESETDSSVKSEDQNINKTIINKRKQPDLTLSKYPVSGCNSAPDNAPTNKDASPIKEIMQSHSFTSKKIKISYEDSTDIKNNIARFDLLNAADRPKSRRISTRRNSFTAALDAAPHPVRRLKRCLSADIDAQQKRMITHKTSTFLSKIEISEEEDSVSKASSFLAIPARCGLASAAIHTIREEDLTCERLDNCSNNNSQLFNVYDSQNIKLYLSSCSEEISNEVLTNNNEMTEKSDLHSNGFDSEKDIQNNNVLNTLNVPKLSVCNERGVGTPSTGTDSPHSTALPDSSNHHLEEKSYDSVKATTSHDSTASVDIDSPLMNEKPSYIKNKPYLSNGYTSSTPENAGFTENMHSKALNNRFLISDSEGDCTPPYPDYSKPTENIQVSKLSTASKLDLSCNRSNSSLSPLRNGHSHNLLSRSADSGVPTFDIQIHYDDNNEFVSMCVVNTDSDLGSDMSKELQRLSRRMSSDHYSGDVSKTTSPSSVTSGGLLQLRSSFISTTSSTSSSSRTSDGAFAIPQRPRRALTHQNLITVKGVPALKQKIVDIISEAYVSDDSARSLSHDDKILIDSFDDDKKQNDSNGKMEGSDSIANNRGTPKSSKKKIQLKGKRCVQTKSERTVLPITNEESLDFLEGINSPEMIPTDTDRCQRSTASAEKNDDITSPKLAKFKDKKATGSSPGVSSITDNFPHSDPFLNEAGTLVMAKWADRRYYSGKVKKALDFNKYMIEFDDGQLKTISDDFIIFGNSRDLPLVGQSIYAMVDEDQTYEPGLVLSVEENEYGTVCYKCTTDRQSMVSVVPSEIYLTEDQAKSIKENCSPKSPHSAPTTPRRRGPREPSLGLDLNLDNIISGPRTARLRDKSTPSRRRLEPCSPKASTSGAYGRGARKGSSSAPKRRQESESSEGEASRAPSVASVGSALEEVSGVQPEVQKTPRKIHGVQARPLLIKGLSKINLGKKNSKVAKFESDDETISRLGPIPPEGSNMFSGLHFILTCTDIPSSRNDHDRLSISPHSERDKDQYYNSSPGTEKEDNVFTSVPFQKERLKEQLEKGGGTVHSHFEDIPKIKYGDCKLIAPRPCLTAKYIQCLGANLKALKHSWVIMSCSANRLVDMNEHALPTGWSLQRKRFISWEVSAFERLSATPFKDSMILVCSENDSFCKFWERVCSLGGANTALVSHCEVELNGALAVVTESECPHELQNKAAAERVPLVSSIWVVQCLIEGKLCDPQSSHKYSFTYNDTD